jgi:ubiquinone/menaquinone biosynthesis C-methylase UbiE
MNNHLLSQWEANALAFAQLINGKGTPHHRKILNPCIDRLIGEVKRKKLLDAGCGEGYLSRVYSKKGADVVGVDFSPKLIALSQKKSKDLDIEFLIADICQLDPLNANQFDIVLCNLVLLNVECLKKSLQEFYRVLRPGGFLIFSVVHPAFNVYGPGRWELGEKGKNTGRRRGRYFIVDQYFTEKEFHFLWKSRSGDGFPQKFSFFHRTSSTYVNQVINTGFRLTALKEPLPIDRSHFFDRERRIPFFLVIKAEKP